MKVKNDHHSEFSNLSNWKEEAWKKKKIRPSTGFEPVTSALPVRCSTNWAMKPHIGSEVNLLSSYLTWGVKWWEVYEIIHIWTAVVDESEEWSSQYIFQFKQLERRSLKKIRASTGFEPVTSALPVRCSTNWAMKPHIGSEVNLLILQILWRPLSWKTSPALRAT